MEFLKDDIFKRQNYGPCQLFLDYMRLVISLHSRNLGGGLNRNSSKIRKTNKSYDTPGIRGADTEMSKATKIIFPTDQKKSVGNIDLSNRLSRSMDRLVELLADNTECD